MIRTLIQLNQFYVDGDTNTLLRQTLYYDIMSVRFVTGTNFDNGCSCGTSSSCTRSQGFYCTATSCFNGSTQPIQTIPGLVHSCLPMDSLLASSLKCFYNASCIQILINWRSFDSYNITTDPRLRNVTELDPLLNSSFSYDTTLDKIVSQLFIEDWTDSSNFSEYYTQCAPSECTYTYEERFSTAYLISTVLGIVGGLSVALRILILPMVKLNRRIYHHCCRSAQRVVREGFVETGRDECIT